MPTIALPTKDCKLERESGTGRIAWRFPHRSCEHVPRNCTSRDGTMLSHAGDGI